MPKRVVSTSKGKKDYNLTISPMWSTRNGNSFMSIEIGPEQFDALAKVQVGGKLVFRLLADESKKTDVSPDAYLEYISKEKNEAYKASRAAAAPAPRGDDDL